MTVDVADDAHEDAPVSPSRRRGGHDGESPSSPSRRPTVSRHQSHDLPVFDRLAEEEETPASRPKVPQRRGVARTKSSDGTSSIRGNAAARSKTNRLQRYQNTRPPRGAGGRAPPGRTTSVDNILGPGGRFVSRNQSDLSSFTADSLSGRRNHLIADPLDDGTYDEGYSYADHDSVSRDSMFSEYPMEGDALEEHQGLVSRIPIEMRMNREGKGDMDDDDDDDSFASGLTNDFDDHSVNDDSDDEDESKEEAKEGGASDD